MLIALFVPFAIGMVLVALFLRWRTGKTAGQQRRLDAWRTVAGVLPLCLIVVTQVVQHRTSPGTILGGGAILFLVLDTWFRYQKPFRPDEILASYAKDPSRCAQCEYDLTGNASGICPECGWRIPDKVPPAADVPWAYWWKRWRIEHVDNWRKRLWQVALWAALFGGIAVFMAFRRFPAGVAVTGCMCALSLLNAGRLIAYARGQARTR